MPTRGCRLEPVVEVQASPELARHDSSAVASSKASRPWLEACAATIVALTTKAWADIDRSTILNSFKKCRLVDGIPDDDDTRASVVEADVMNDLMANCAIVDTIDPRQRH